MLFTPTNEPIPPQDALRRLKAIDERLAIRWVPSAGGAYWAITEIWPPNDARWEMVRRGEVPESYAFDIRAMLPPDCSPHDAEGFVMRAFERVSDPAKQATDKMARLQKANAEVKQNHVQRFLEEQEHKTATTTKHDYEVQLGVSAAHPMVSGADLSTADAPKKRRIKSAV